jgi:hypothetical protein
MCKLISLNFTSKYTKISIQDHVITLQEPTEYQWAVRLWNGDGKENVSELYYVIIRLINWFIIIKEDYVTKQLNEDKNYIKISESVKFKKLVNYLCDAFKKLQETYQYGNVVLSLQFYINILQSSVNYTFNDNMIPINVPFNKEDDENLLDYEKIRNFWTLGKIEKICDYYDACFYIRNDIEITDNIKQIELASKLTAISFFLQIMDEEFQELIMNSYKG